MYDVLSNLFNNLAGVTKIIVPAVFRSARGYKAVKCSVKASEGLLYPLKSSLIFIHKPVHYIRHSEIKFVEFSRIAQGGQAASRSFDLTLTKLKDGTTVSFTSIEKEEQKVLTEYFKAANIKMRVVDPESQARMEMDDLDESSSNNSADSGEVKEGKGGRRKAAEKVRKGEAGDVDMQEYDSEDDEDFVDQGSAQDNSEEGEDEMEEGEEEDGSASGVGDGAIDSEVDKDELKEMKKQAEKNANLGKRQRRPAKD